METKRSECNNLTECILNAGAQLAEDIKAKAMFVYLELIENPNRLKTLKFEKTSLILVVKDPSYQKLADALGFKTINVPQVSLSRMGLIKTSVLLAFSQRMLDREDSFIFIVGPTNGQLDTIMAMQVGHEWEIFQSVNQTKLTEHIKRVVFQRVLTIALELASEGREGKPIGTIFVLGDDKNVMQYCEQIILNPFRGYPESERNVLDDNMKETIKNFAALDGAFIIKGNGTILSAGTYLKGVKIVDNFPHGLGARHAAAAGITAVTKSIAITISESTGTVRIWRKGEMITEIEKPTPAPHHNHLSDSD